MPQGDKKLRKRIRKSRERRATKTPDKAGSLAYTCRRELRPPKEFYQKLGSPIDFPAFRLPGTQTPQERNYETASALLESIRQDLSTYTPEKDAQIERNLEQTDFILASSDLTGINISKLKEKYSELSERYQIIQKKSLSVYSGGLVRQPTEEALRRIEISARARKAQIKKQRC